jgi:hypothetical protein
MITNLEEYLIGIVIGIRFRANFSIEDQLGQIVDHVLYSKDSFFGPSVFPKVYNRVNEKILINEDTNDNLRIDNSNIILEVNFIENSTGFHKKDVSKIYKNFHNQIINGIMKKYKIREIIRIGLVKRYLFDIDALADSFVDKTIGRTLEGVNDINLRFSKKLPVTEAFIKKDIYDYNNVIFNVIKTADRDEIFMAVDYQQLFDPFLSASSHIKFDEFINSVNSFNDNKYLPWLNSNYGEIK